MTHTKVRIPVTGMHCAACQSRVQSALQKQEGVTDAAVNLMMGNATVTYDPAATTPERLAAAVRETGYGAELAAQETSAFEEQESRDRAQAEEFSDLRRKAIVSGAAGVLAMIFSMPLMAAAANHGHGPVADPFMRWAMTTLTPWL